MLVPSVNRKSGGYFSDRISFSASGRIPRVTEPRGGVRGVIEGKRGIEVSAEADLRFLRDFQRLLNEGDFSSTYKFALLRALADLSVERVVAYPAGLELSVRDIAEKFIEYYWRQARPFRNAILSQSGKGQAEVVTAVVECQGRYSHSFAEVRSKPAIWRKLVKRVARNVERDPLRRLQTLSSGSLYFLYENPGARGESAPPEDVTILLRAGAVRAFRQFHPLILSLLEAAWVRRVLCIRSNASMVSEGSDIGEFLFGSDRRPLDAYRDALLQVHQSRCFYCDSKPRRELHVDHFIPWSRYPIDLGHNFVLACRACNESKRDHLAGTGVLSKWKSTNIDDGQALSEVLLSRGLPGDPHRALTVARWAYEQAEGAQVLVWAGRKQFERLGSGWRPLLSMLSDVALAAEEAEKYE